MRDLEQATLVAYADGELDAETAEQVEARLAQDADTRATLRKLRQSAAWLEAAFTGVEDEPIPPRLMKAATPPLSRQAEIVRFPRFQADSFLRNVSKIAAALLFLIAGGAAGFLGADARLQHRQHATALAEADTETAIQQVLYSALEHERSGEVVRWEDPLLGSNLTIVPTRTFYGEESGYCREYRREVQSDKRTSVVHGVACRRAEGDWAVRYELIQGSHIPQVSKPGI